MSPFVTQRPYYRHSYICRQEARVSVRTSRLLFLFVVAFSITSCRHSPDPAKKAMARDSVLFRSLDLDVGESSEVALADGAKASVAVLDLQEATDSPRGAIRQARVKVLVNGQEATLTSATYHLPVTVAGVQ